MGNGHGGELSPDKPPAPIMEAFEATVVFDLPEDGFRLYRAHAPMVQPTFSGEPFPDLVPVQAALDVHFHRPVSFALEAHPPKWAAIAVLCAV